jgi:MerR family transcriptional regulator, mercuric resistance operon regulatory protein
MAQQDDEMSAPSPNVAPNPATHPVDALSVRGTREAPSSALVTLTVMGLAPPFDFGHYATRSRYGFKPQRITTMRGLTIGQLAKSAAVNLETVRYYERIGLIAAPARTEGGHRTYDEEAIRHLAFVRRARDLGFSIHDIRALLTLAAPGRNSCAEVRNVASAHLVNVRTKLADLAKLEAILSATIAKCGDHPSPDCPVLDILDTGTR